MEKNLEKTSIPMEGAPVSYRIYITKSPETARVLAAGLKNSEIGSRYGGKTFSVSHGCVNENIHIPAIYHGSENFYAMAKYRNGETGFPQEYEIVLC
ncbi:MAG: hypothetical protein ACOX8K_10175 [Lachnospiraceae bacterium]|jgi:hypothetical protein